MLTVGLPRIDNVVGSVSLLDTEPSKIDAVGIWVALLTIGLPKIDPVVVKVALLVNKPPKIEGVFVEVVVLTNELSKIEVVVVAAVLLTTEPPKTGVELVVPKIDDFVVVLSNIEVLPDVVVKAVLVPNRGVVGEDAEPNTKVVVVVVALIVAESKIEVALEREAAIVEVELKENGLSAEIEQGAASDDEIETVGAATVLIITVALVVLVVVVVLLDVNEDVEDVDIELALPNIEDLAPKIAVVLAVVTDKFVDSEEVPNGNFDVSTNVVSKIDFVVAVAVVTVAVRVLSVILAITELLIAVLELLVALSVVVESKVKVSNIDDELLLIALAAAILNIDGVDAVVDLNIGDVLLVLLKVALLNNWVLPNIGC